jgi:hypothetical protein
MVGQEDTGRVHAQVKLIESEALVDTGAKPLLGQIQLEEVDLILDPKNRELRVNPASPDAPLLDLLRAS